MDPLAGVINGPRAAGAFLLRSLLEPPWSLRIQDEAPLTLVAVVRGEAWVLPDGEQAVRLDEGDVAIVRGPRHYAVSDAPGTPAQVVIHPGQRCTTLLGADLAEPMALGVRTWGNSATGSTVLLTGTYTDPAGVSQRLLTSLPRLAVQAAGEVDPRLVALLRDEVGRDAPGQEAVLDRLLDLLLVATLRSWFARPDSGAPSWLRAQDDPMVGPAVRLLQNNPAYPWTVARLASEVGVSRAALARRFQSSVGQSPIAFLTTWRLSLAADLLAEESATLERVARQVGYGTPFALSAAFKRLHGVSPREYRSRRPALAGETAASGYPG